MSDQEQQQAEALQQRLIALHSDVLRAKAAVADAVFALHQAQQQNEMAQRALALAEARLSGAQSLIPQTEAKDAKHMGT